MTKSKYIVVEGPIGVGKTSLAKILANEFQARTIFERWRTIRFCPKFYQARESYAFQNQTFFLLNRYQQQMELGAAGSLQPKYRRGLSVCQGQDFRDLDLEHRRAESLSANLCAVEYSGSETGPGGLSQARPEVLYKRVKKRDKKYERGVTFEYLTRGGSGVQPVFLSLR